MDVLVAVDDEFGAVPGEHGLQRRSVLQLPIAPGLARQRRMMNHDELPRRGGGEHLLADVVRLHARGAHAVGLVRVGVDDEDGDVADLNGVVALVVGEVEVVEVRVVAGGAVPVAVGPLAVHGGAWTICRGPAARGRAAGRRRAPR